MHWRIEPEDVNNPYETRQRPVPELSDHVLWYMTVMLAFFIPFLFVMGNVFLGVIATFAVCCSVYIFYLGEVSLCERTGERK